MAYEFLVLKLVEREAISTFLIVVVMLYVRNSAFVHLQHNVLCRCVLLFVFVHRLEVLSYHRTVWNDVCTEEERECRDKYARNHVRAHKALERNSCSKHGYDFGV